MDAAILELQRRARALTYPNGIIDRTGAIQGPGFFPAGSGLKGPEPLNQRPLMILGHDQDNEAGLNRTLRSSLERGEQYSSTWTNLLSLLSEAEISERQCFFTNAIMGIRKASSNTGLSPAFKHPEFIAACADLLFDQIRSQRPKAIVCLGLRPFRVLGLLSKQLAHITIGVESFSDLDQLDIDLLRNIRFDTSTDLTATIAVITHPSYRRLNAKRRSIRGITGHGAEVELLRNLTRTWEG